ncbi:MAG: vWA domain-containing protein, partial [Culicoidibacterales bacterium]
MKCKKIVSLILAMAFCLQPVFAVATTMPTKYDSVASIRNEEAKYGEQTQISVDQQASKVTENKVSVKQTFTPQAEATAAMLIQQTVQENWAIDPTTFKITAATEAIVSEVALTTAEPQLAYFLSSEGRYLQVRGAQQALILTYDVIFSGEVASETAKLFTAQTLSVGEVSDQFLALAPEVTYATQALETTVPETVPDEVVLGGTEVLEVNPIAETFEVISNQSFTFRSNTLTYNQKVSKVIGATNEFLVELEVKNNTSSDIASTYLEVWYNIDLFNVVTGSVDPSGATVGTNGMIRGTTFTLKANSNRYLKFRLRAKQNIPLESNALIFYGEREFASFKYGETIQKIGSSATVSPVYAMITDPQPVTGVQTIADLGSNEYAITLTTTNNSAQTLTNAKLDADIFANHFDVTDTALATETVVETTVNNLVYTSRNLAWTLTLAPGATHTVTFKVKLKVGANLGIGDNNIYTVVNNSEPQLTFSYLGGTDIVTYSYQKMTIEKESSNSATCPIVELETPTLLLDKTATKVEGSNNLYDLTLRVDGNPTVTPDKPMDIIMLIDRSGSMYKEASELKKALQKFVETMITPGQSNVRMAVASYGTTAITHSGFNTDLTALTTALADIAFVENGTIVVKKEAYTTVNSENKSYTVTPHRDATNGEITTATLYVPGIINAPNLPVATNNNGDLYIKTPAGLSSSHFFEQTNTELGLITVDKLLAQSVADAGNDPCREKYVIVFSDGEPNYYMWNDETTIEYDKTVVATDAKKRIQPTIEAKAKYEQISKKYQNLSTQSIGFFSSDSTGKGFEFMYYIQDKVRGPLEYYQNNFTDTASELDPIFEAIATELKGSTYYDVAKDMVVSDIVTPQFILASDPNFRYTGLTPTTVTIADPKVECDNVDTGLKEQCDQLTFDYDGQMLTTEGATITFTIQVKNEYYGKTAVDTNVRAAVEAWNNPFTDEPDPQAPLEFEVPNVDIPLITGKISVLKAIADNAAVPDAIKFDFFVNGQGDLIPG